MQCLVYVTVANGVIRCSQSLDHGICKAKLKILFLSKRKVKQIRSFQLNAEVNGDGGCVVPARCGGILVGGGGGLRNRVPLSLQAGSMSFSGFLPSVEGYFVYSVKNF